MSRYINADKLREDEIARCHCVPVVGSGDNNYKDLDEVLKDAPTADVVEVVRCKDCRYCEEAHYEEEGENPYIKLKCKWSNYSHQPNDFCSYGERKER